MGIEDYYRQFLDAGYRIGGFEDYNPSMNNQIILRHDIDYDVGLALRCAELEYDLGIRASYFFLLRSEFYNPFGMKEYHAILRIRDLGHQISVHFDPSLYEDEEMEFGLNREIALFNHLFQVNVEIISFHRPADRFLKLEESISGIDHTYLPKFFKEIAYYSDSMGLWRYGSPLESRAFLERANIHLLMHPVWWFEPGSSNLEIIRNLYNRQVRLLKETWKDNSKLFKELGDGI